VIKKIIEIATEGARLSVMHRQLVIERPARPVAAVPCEDIGVLIVDHRAVTYTHSVFTTLIEFGAAVVLCGADHHPAGLLLPMAGNTVQTERYRSQVEASLPLRKQLWRALVSAKLRQQGDVLEEAIGSDAGLKAMASRVRSGDPTNLEAQGAQRYWPRLFGPAFRRDRAGPPPNNLLNYGYAILRAAMARALVAAGLMPTLGIHHHNRYNAFCLADDAMEPYRPFVDRKVRALCTSGTTPDSLDRETKQTLLGLFNDTIEIAGRRTPLLLALHATAASFAQSFLEDRAEIALPRGLPRLADDEPEKEPADAGAA